MACCLTDRAGPLQNKFNPIEKKSKKFSWVRTCLAAVMILVILVMLVVYLVLGLVNRDVTSTREEPRPAGFKIEDDGAVHFCQCGVSSYSLVTLMGTLELDEEVFDELALCQISPLDCYDGVVVCKRECGLPFGANCMDFGACDEEMAGTCFLAALVAVRRLTVSDCVARCEEGLRQCYEDIRGALETAIYGEPLYTDYDDDTAALLSVDICEYSCFAELIAAAELCENDHYDHLAECHDNRREAIAETTDSLHSESFALLSTFCERRSPFSDCIFGNSYQLFGECLRYTCGDPSLCTFFEREVLNAEVLGKLNTMLGNTVISVPSYYGDETKTVQSIEQFVEQTVSSWTSFLLTQARESLAAVTTLCADGKGLCTGATTVYTPLHSIDEAQLEKVLRRLLLDTVDRNRREIYRNYIELCGDVDCIVFKKKSAFATIMAAVGKAGGLLPIVTLFLALLYAPIHARISKQTASEEEI